MALPNLISSIDLREFRGIKSLEKPLPLKHFTVLLGENACGKTSVLDALSLLPHPNAPTPKPLNVVKDCGHRAEVLKTIRGRFESLVYGYEGEAVVHASVGGKEAVLEVSSKGFGRARGDGSRSLDVSEACTAFGLDVDDVVYLPSSGIFVRALEGGLYSQWPMVEKRGAHTAASEVFGDEVSEVVPRFNELFVRRVVGGTSRYVRLRDVGALERTLLAVTWIEVLKPKVVLWDDVDAGLHQTAIKALAKWLSEGDFQVVASAHSPRTAELFKEACARDVQQLVLRKDLSDVVSFEQR